MTRGGASSPDGRNGLYIVLEGQDGTGKTTQVELLAGYLREHGHDVITLREPGGGLAATEIMRELLKNKEYDLDPVTITLIFAANRRELWAKTIEPALKLGKTVISDRNWWSTLAYEHYGFGVPAEVVTQIHEQSLPERYLKPDLGLIFTLDDAERQRRLSSRDGKQTQDTFESQKDDFQSRVNAGYIEIAARYGVPTIDASGTIEEIQAAIIRVLDDAAG
ncbi:MAG: dTMP kinase [Candidatus Nomurabacteria bacterium]|jgi:dTMP kinase|nr:dTMP kinase [Candidatus Nomurabacteria bacterium]